MFDGGYINLSIASKNNTIKHSTFRNATYRTMMGWHNQDGSGNASATISYSLIENSATVGLVSHYLNLNMSYTTIQNNAQAGLYISSNTVNPFHHNLVTGNGGSTRDGIEVSYSGTLLMRKALTYPGHNEVSGNGEDQISNYGTLEVGQGYNGENSIYGSYSGSKYFVENNTGTTVVAENTWWGVAQPVSGMFSGPVNYSAPLHYDPLSGITHGHDGQAPAKVQGNPASIEEEYNRVESLLSQAESKQEVRDRLHQMFILTFQDDDPALTARFNALARNAAEGQAALQSGTEVTKTFQDYAQVLYAKSLIRDDEYKNAQAWLDDFNPEALDGYDRRDWLHLRMVTQTYHGEYETALETLEDYYAFQESQGEDMEEVRANNSPIEEDIRARLEARGGQSDEDQHSEEITSSKELNMGNYPNPFNPTTNIRFTLPERSQVSLVVYDMLGREVANLVNEVLPAGEQTVRFDASSLANGLYLYRLRAGNQVISKKMTLIK